MSGFEEIVFVFAIRVKSGIILNVRIERAYSERRHQIAEGKAVNRWFLVYLQRASGPDSLYHGGGTAGAGWHFLDMPTFRL